MYIFFFLLFKSAIYSYFINRGLKERRSASLKIKIHEEKVGSKEILWKKRRSKFSKDIQAWK